MDNKKGLLPFISIVILSISLIIASRSISDAINNVGLNLSASSSNFSSGGNYELIVEDGWMFLYDITNGQVWKMDSNTTASNWEEVRHFSR